MANVLPCDVMQGCASHPKAVVTSGGIELAIQRGHGREAVRMPDVTPLERRIGV